VKVAEPPIPSDLLTIAQAHDEMPWYSKRYLRGLRDNRAIPSYKLGPHPQSPVCFSRTDLVAYVIYSPSARELVDA
jgi:hypothetical protein